LIAVSQMVNFLLVTTATIGLYCTVSETHSESLLILNNLNI